MKRLPQEKQEGDRQSKTTHNSKAAQNSHKMQNRFCTHASFTVQTQLPRLFWIPFANWENLDYLPWGDAFT